MCCAFKMKPLNEIFKGRRYVDLAMELQAFDKDSALTETDLPDSFQKSLVPQPGQGVDVVNNIFGDFCQLSFFLENQGYM
jgi:hypothetical protein